jgi:hypothetical protein
MSNGSDSQPTSWMTITGVVMVAVAGGLGAAAQIIPIPELKPWLDCAAIFLGSVAAGLMGQGIRRNIPTMRASGRAEALTESRAGVNDQPR